MIASDPGGRGGRFWKRGSGCATAKQKSGQQVSSLGKGFRAASENSKNFHETDPSRVTSRINTPCGEEENPLRREEGKKERKKRKGKKEEKNVKCHQAFKGPAI